MLEEVKGILVVSCETNPQEIIEKYEDEKGLGYPSTLTLTI